MKRSCLLSALLLSALLITLPCTAEAVHHVPGNKNTILFTPCQWELQYDGAAFVTACVEQGYASPVEVRDQVENTTPCVTPEEFRNYLRNGYGEWFLDTHGLWNGFTIMAYEHTSAGETARNIDYDYWVSRGFEGDIYKSESEHAYSIDADPVFVGINYADVDGEVYNTACFGGVYEHVAWLWSRVNEGYLDTNYTADSDAELFWERRNGGFGKPYRLSGRAREGMELRYFGDSCTVLSPVVSAIYPTSGSSVGGVDGWVEFDCAMDTDIPANRIVRGYGDPYGGRIVVKNAEWVSDDRIEYRISPVVTGSGCGVIIDSGLVRTPSGQVLDGNQIPLGSDGRGPNRDQYKVSYTATDVDTSTAAGFEGTGAFAAGEGDVRVWWVTDPERGSRSFTVYGDGAALRMVPAEGGPDRPHFYEVPVPGGYETYRVVETDGGGSAGSETRPFRVSAPPENLEGLRELNLLVEGWHRRTVEPMEWSGADPVRSGTVYDLYFVSRFQDLLNAAAPLRDWWSAYGFSSTTVLLSTSDPDELHALAQSVHQDVVEQGYPRPPLFVIVGESNEGLEPEKNIVGMYSPADVDGGCWWSCASDAMTFDVDGDTLADFPWTRVVGYTYEEIDREASSALDWLNGDFVHPTNRTLFTAGNRTAGCTAVAEPLATLLEVKSLFESEGVPTVLLKDSDYGCYDDAGRLHDWCAQVDAGVGGVFLS